MLHDHLKAVEAKLLATSRIPANSGHPLHKGTPRETFIKEFLTGHLSRRVDIGTGEIIDPASQPNQPRNQIDIVLYKPEYPRIEFGTDIYAFLVESVIATIEVKSTLTRDTLRDAIATAHRLKALQRPGMNGVFMGYQPPTILTFVIAYDGPSSIDTVYGWLAGIHTELGISLPTLPLSGREAVKNPSIDGIIILGKGSVTFDNAPINFMSDAQRQATPQGHWVVIPSTDSNLLQFFMLLMMAVSGASVQPFDPTPYLQSVRMSSSLKV